MNRRLLLLPILLYFPATVAAEDIVPEVLDEAVEDRREDETTLDEDPEEQRRTRVEIAEASGETVPGEVRGVELSSSLRVHAINTFDLGTGERENKVSDGGSRVGARAFWKIGEDGELFARAEFGFDLVENFSTRGDASGSGGLKDRLLFAGYSSEHLAITFGKNWGAYNKVAGNTDRFSIFGGSASGLYNAGTSGQATGTGRADDVLQARFYVNTENRLSFFKPFNLNLQYQLDQAIPRIDNERYDYGYAASAWLETQDEIGLGIAYNRSVLQNPASPAIRDAGMDGDSTAFAVASRWFGENWYVSALYARLENMEVTDRGRYFNGDGAELYAQWRINGPWWLIGGGNWLQPDDADVGVGEYRVFYYVLGGRYTFDSFDRMAYFEYRFDRGRLTDSTRGKDELTFGIRWDFGY